MLCHSMPSARNRIFVAAITALLAVCVPVLAANKPVPAAAKPTTDGLPKDAYKVPAKKLFGRQSLPADLKPRAIGTYAKGCLAGAKAVPVDGEAWQVMRLSRNRNWGHPELVAVVEELARDAKKDGYWNGLLWVTCRSPAAVCRAPALTEA